MTATPGSRSQPHFLCIGAPKCGTTWLYKRLATHPDIWLPPVKELRYFNKRYPVAGAVPPPSRRMGLFGLFRNYPRRAIVQALRRMVAPRGGFPVAWTLRFLRGPGDFDWYADLFSPARGRMGGDITPFYASLSEEAVAHIHQRFPHLKVIFLMRDPIERAWSNARMMLPLMTGRSLQSLTEQDFLDYLADDAAHVEGDYLHTLDAWGRRYPGEQFFCAYYEQISQDPQALLDQVTDLLEVRRQTLPAASLEERVNAGKTAYASMPPAAQRLCAERYLDPLATLSERLGPPATRWYQQAQAVLNNR